MTNILALLGQCTGYLFRRPLFGNKKAFGLFHDILANRTIAWLLALCAYCICLGCFPVIASSNSTVTSYFTRHCTWTYIYRFGNVFLFHSILE